MFASDKTRMANTMTSEPLMEAYRELGTLVEAAPDDLKQACYSLSNYQNRLFTTVCADHIRVEPSKFLCRLLATMRVGDWPKVVNMIQGMANTI